MPDSAEHRHQYYLAAIPFVAYFCIFAYEAGRYTYLGIPLDYLEVPVQRIAQLAFIALLCVLIGAALLTFLIALAESKSNRLLSRNLNVLRIRRYASLICLSLSRAMRTSLR